MTTLRRAGASAAIVALMLLSIGCVAIRHGRPIVGGSTIADRSGTISGTVRYGDGSPVVGRRVSAINESTASRYDATTGASGGYTIEVPVGKWKYRLEVELLGGDVLSKQPEPTEITKGDVDSQRDFVIGR